MKWNLKVYDKVINGIGGLCDFYAIISMHSWTEKGFGISYAKRAI
jgi:hypothetical protein